MATVAVSGQGALIRLLNQLIPEAKKGLLFGFFWVIFFGLWYRGWVTLPPGS